MAQSNASLVTLLPEVNQSDTLKNFFASTVDQLFSPGASEPISGYIGQQPVYYNPLTDFYIAENNLARTAYQLDPLMISTNTSGIITNTLSYDDLINYLSSQGANVSDPSRMFEGDYYSWAPPVDLDLLNNYLQYVWMGALTGDEANVAITLTAPRSHTFYSGSNAYSLPSAIDGIDSSLEYPVVIVNGVTVPCNVTNGVATIATSGFNSNTLIETIRYGDLTQVINGNMTFDYTPFLAWNRHYPDYTSNLYEVTRFNVGDLAYGVSASNVSGIYCCTVSHVATSNFAGEIPLYWELTDIQLASTGHRLALVDGIEISQANARTFFVDGVGQSIILTDDHTADPSGSAAHYVIIDRRSIEKSPWANRNMWVHSSTLKWSNVDFSSRVAQRPILQFLPNLELYNYGSNRLPDVQGLLSAPNARVVDDFSVYPFGDMPWDTGLVTTSSINGQFFGRLNDAEYDGGTTTDTTYIGSVVVAGGYVLQPNDRLFVHQSTTTEPLLNNLIYTVVDNPNILLPSGATVDVVELVITGQPQRGDVFRLVANGASVFSDPQEYWYDGAFWRKAQSGASFPLFRLYDSNQNPLDDLGVYAGTDFAGSKLFSYQIGNGVVDSVLGISINYNSYSQPIFQVDPVVNRVTYNGGTISGYYYYHIIDTTGETDGTYSNYWFPIANASTQSVSNGVYDIPLNLQANPNNQEVTTISRNQWFSQFSEIMTDQANFVGQPYSVNNWRDTAKVLDYGNEILQHRAPLLKTMLVSANTNFDIPASLTFAEQEYIRYRNKFVQNILKAYQNGTLTTSDSYSTWVSEILLQQRLNKTNQFPFAGSSMAGGQYFMPPTPASLGIAPVAIPVLVTDNSYVNPINMIRGHDGSLTPAFNDFRDHIMLALETTIYRNIPAEFKTESRPIFDLMNSVSGKFYTDSLSYTQVEITEIITPMFLRWVQTNRLDFRTNSTYDSSNPFTWNYSGLFDPDGVQLSGSWKAIYLYYYDTYQPHLAPWEMLGFIDKPTWWLSQYGPAPYTSGNTKLWDDIKSGNIRGGPRVGINTRYARENLYDYLPVDQEGNLLNPMQIGIVTQAPIYSQATADWQIGDYGPVESLWRSSSSYGFALAQAGFLGKPARFVEQGWDTINQVQDSTGQWIYSLTGDRPNNSELLVHGELTTSNTVVSVTGIQQWITDYMLSRGQPASIFGNAIRGLEVRLGHKMAGFINSSSMTVAADNFGLVPAEDYGVHIYTSPSIAEYVYSGTLIEKTNQGWRVIGYDTRTPSFTVIPPLTSGPSGIISLSSTAEPTIKSWHASVYYPVGTLVSYMNEIYSCTTSHTSARTFNVAYWNLSGPIPQQAPRVTVYTFGTNIPQTVPYGTEFTTYQQVADFLTGYDRYLVSCGWLFDAVDSATQETIDWNLMTKQFLAWAQVNWQTGNFITLSPGAYQSGLRFKTDQGYALNMLTPINGVYGITDRAGLPIKRKNVVVNRTGQLTSILSTNNDIYGARINLAETEHVLIFNNSTIFNDIIYAPLFNLRQPRLLLIGFRSTNWTGLYNAPGFVLIDNQIESNFTKSANDFVSMFDIEYGDNATFVDHARHNIGYDERDYLSTLVLSEVEQFEFYQGMIHQKGAPGAFDKLLRSTYVDQNTDINFFEEWAVLQSEYGAVNNRNRIAFLFGQTSVLRDPQYVEFRVINANSVVGSPDPTWIELVDNAVASLDPQWVERPPNPLAAFPTRSSIARKNGDAPVAGYVRLDEIDYTVFNSVSVPDIYNSTVDATLQSGEVVWVHQNNVARGLPTSNAGSNWYVLGTRYNNGFWDGSNVQTLANSYTETNDGSLIFVSKPNDAPFVTDDNQFVPLPGQTYTVTFMIMKTAEPTNGASSYVRPAFDAFVANGTITGGLGTKNGVGYNPTIDLVDTSTWSLNIWYVVSATWQCPMTPNYTSARGRIRINRTYPSDNTSTIFSDATYELSSSAISLVQPQEWDALKVYNMSIDGSPNQIANVVTYAEDQTLANSVMRIYTVNPHGLTNQDQGLYFVVDGISKSNPNLQGVQTIMDVGGANYIDVSNEGIAGFDFIENNQTGPDIRIIRSIHFLNMTEFAASKSRYGLQNGDLAYVDGSPWQVYQLTSVVETTSDYANNQVIVTNNYWNVVRSQPNRIDGTKLGGSLIYDLKTNITTTDIRPYPLSLDYMTVVSPLTGIFPGRAMKEIDFMLDFDPAAYNEVPSPVSVIGGNTNTVATTTGSGQWGPAMVGRVWWDMSTVRFLETETDNVTFGLTGTKKYNDEVRYRIANWGQIAPATNVDVYEWIRSPLNPFDYTQAVIKGTYVGTVYNAETPSWIETMEMVGNQPAKFYYFWVSGLDTVPNVPFRSLSVSTVSQFIINPMIEDEPWIAPIMPNGVLIGGVSPFVDDVFDTNADGTAISGTVVQIDVENAPDDAGVVHEEWILLRPNDELSTPPNWLWDKLRDSLVGFGDNQRLIQPPTTVTVTNLPTANQKPIWYTGPGPNDVPIND